MKGRQVEAEVESQKAAQEATVAPSESEVRIQEVPVDDESLKAPVSVPGSSSGVTSENASKSMLRVEERMVSMMETMVDMMRTFQEYVQAQGQRRAMASERPPSPESFQVGLEQEEEKKRKSQKGSSQSRRQRLKARQTETPISRGVYFQCGQYGHKRVNCPQYQGSAQEQTSEQPQSQGPGQRPIKQLICYLCGQPGHRWKECPQLPVVAVPSELQHPPLARVLPTRHDEGQGQGTDQQSQHSQADMGDK